MRLAVVCWLAAAAAASAAATAQATRFTTTAAAVNSQQTACAPISCAGLPGVWTGFIGSRALFDEYSLVYEDGATPGEFEAVVIHDSGGGWTLGVGQLSADNTTVVLKLDVGLTLTGTVDATCSVLTFDNGSSWHRTSGIEVVHLLSMSHIDVGYHVGYTPFARIIEVLQTYVDVYFPRAIAIARALRDLGGDERLV